VLSDDEPKKIEKGGRVVRLAAKRSPYGQCAAKEHRSPGAGGLPLPLGFDWQIGSPAGQYASTNARPRTRRMTGVLSGVGDPVNGLISSWRRRYSGGRADAISLSTCFPYPYEPEGSRKVEGESKNVGTRRICALFLAASTPYQHPPRLSWIGTMFPMGVVSDQLSHVRGVAVVGIVLVRRGRD